MYMRRRKVDLQVRGNCSVFDDGILKISKEGSNYYFEIGGEVTFDVAEAVAIMMRVIDWSSPVWTIGLSDIDTSKMSPERALYWLSGGNTEWRSLDNYDRPWCECYLDFQEEFGSLVYNIITNSSNMKDIRNAYVDKLGLPVLYEFALSKNFVK